MHDRLVPRRIDALHQCFLVFVLCSFIFGITCTCLYFVYRRQLGRKAFGLKVLLSQNIV